MNLLKRNINVSRSGIHYVCPIGFVFVVLSNISFIMVPISFFTCGFTVYFFIAGAVLFLIGTMIGIKEK